MAKSDQQQPPQDAEPEIVSPPQPEASRYSMADFMAEAGSFTVTIPDGTERTVDAPAIAGIFREAGSPADMTEAEFRDGLQRWYGERQ